MRIHRHGRDCARIFARSRIRSKDALGRSQKKEQSASLRPALAPSASSKRHDLEATQATFSRFSICEITLLSLVGASPRSADRPLVKPSSPVTSETDEVHPAHAWRVLSSVSRLMRPVLREEHNAPARRLRSLWIMLGAGSSQELHLLRDL